MKTWTLDKLAKLFTEDRKGHSHDKKTVPIHTQITSLRCEVVQLCREKVANGHKTTLFCHAFGEHWEEGVNERGSEGEGGKVVSSRYV